MTTTMTGSHGMTRTSQLLPLTIVLALAPALAGCPADEPPDQPPDTPPTDTPAPPGTEPPPAPPDHTVLEQSCTNQQYGFQVDYPAGWVVNQADGLPPCSAFDPEDASMPTAAEIPRDIAIVIRRDDVAFETVTDFDSDFTVRAVSREETTVAGRPAVVAEIEHTGDGMYQEGDRHYGYYVDLDGRTLIGITHGIDAADPPAYQERQRILDAMMNSLQFQDDD